MRMRAAQCACAIFQQQLIVVKLLNNYSVLMKLGSSQMHVYKNPAGVSLFQSAPILFPLCQVVPDI
jgi:hypothetical protein